MKSAKEIKDKPTPQNIAKDMPGPSPKESSSAILMQDKSTPPPSDQDASARNKPSKKRSIGPPDKGGRAKKKRPNNPPLTKQTSTVRTEPSKNPAGNPSPNPSASMMSGIGSDKSPERGSINSSTSKKRGVHEDASVTSNTSKTHQFTTLPDPAQAGDWIIKALQAIMPPPSTQPPSTHPDPDPLDLGPKLSSQQKTREYLSSRHHHGQGGGGNESLPHPQRTGSISIVGDSDSEYGYHNPVRNQAVTSRARNWRDFSSSSVSSETHSLQAAQSARSPMIGQASGLTDQSQNYRSRDQSRDGALAGISTASDERHQAARILSKYCPQLRADEEDDHETDVKQQSIFRLKSSLGDREDSLPGIKMDGPYKSCFHKLDNRRSGLKPASREVTRDYRIASQDFDNYLCSPTVPDVAFRVGDAGAKKSRYNTLRSRTFISTDRDLSAIDISARNGMRLAIYQGCLITALTEAESLGLTSTDRESVLESLSKIADLQYEQATRSALLTTRLRRSNVLTALNIEREAAKCLARLPCEGKDLFNGKFQDVLDQTISESNTADKTFHKLSSGNRSSSSGYKYRSKSTQSQHKQKSSSCPQDQPQSFGDQRGPSFPSFSRPPNDSNARRGGGDNRRRSQSYRGSRSGGRGRQPQFQSQDTFFRGPGDDQRI